MRHVFLITTVITSQALLSSCSQEAPAQVVYRGHEEFKGSQYASNNTSTPAVNYNNYAPAAGQPMNTAPATTSYDTYRQPANAAPAYMPSDNYSQQGTVNVTPVGISELPAPQAYNTPVNRTYEIPARQPVQETIALNDDGAFIWPVQGEVINNFGPFGPGKTNDGINIAAPSGEPVYAASGGEVVFAGDQLRGYGNMVLIRHSEGRHTTYAHLARMSVDRNQKVAKGQIIGYVGETGDVWEPQLFFALQEGKQPVNPTGYLRNQYAALQ